MFILDWFAGILRYFGLWKKSGKLLILGLENTGKTTLLHMIKDNKLAQPEPVICPACEELLIGNILFTAFNLSCYGQPRRLWPSFFPDVDAILFLIDASDRPSMYESEIELDSLLTKETLSNCPVLILGNKIDKHNAVNEDELRRLFNLSEKTTGKGKVSRSELRGRPLELFMCSTLKGQGYGEGFRWLAQYVDCLRDHHFD